MAAQAGLGVVPQQGGQAGLGDQPLTMSDQLNLSRGLRNQGYSTDQIRGMLGMEDAPPDPAATAAAAAAGPDQTVGILGDLGYGIANTAASTLRGAGELAADQLGWDGAGDALKGLGEYLGPSEAQKAAQDAEAAYRQEQVDAGNMSGTEQFAREAGDAIVESAPSMLTVAAGGAAGGAAAGAIFGPVGAAIGGVGGAIAASLPMMYDEQLQTATQNGLDVKDPEVQRKALIGASINTAMDTITPLKILGKLNKTGALALAEKSILKKGAKEFVKDAVTEGGTEVAQDAVGMILFDPNVAKLSKEDKTALLPYITQTYGRQFALDFIAGAGMGGPAGALAGVHEQRAANAQIKESATVLAKAAETTGAPVENLQDMVKTPEGATKVREAAAAIQMAEVKRQNAKDAYAANPTPEQEKLHKAADASADAVHDHWMPQFGGRKLSEVKAEQAAIRETEKQGAFASLKAQGLTPKADASYEAVTAQVSKVADVTATMDQARERLAVAETPKAKARAQQQYTEAVQNHAKVKAAAAHAIGDTSVTESGLLKEHQATIAKQSAKAAHEADVQQHMASKYPAWMPPAQKQKLAEAAIAKGAVDPDAELKAKHDALLARLATSTNPVKIANIQNQIDRLGTRYGGVSPAVEAAQRVLQGLSGTSGSSALDASPGVVTSVAQVEAAAEATALADKKAAAPSKSAAAVTLKPEDVSPETTARFATAREASKADKTLTPATEAVARDMLTEAGAEPSQANVDILIKGQGAVAKRLAQITKATPTATNATAKAKIPGTDVRRTGTDVDRQHRWKDLLDTVGADTKLDAAEASLRDWTATTGFEAVATYDADGNLLGAGTNNDINAVAMPSNQWQTAATHTHTHPEETPFSRADVLVLIQAAGLQEIRAITPTQTVAMRPKGNLRDYNESGIRALAAPIIAYVETSAPAATEPLSQQRVTQEALLRLLDRVGLIDYATPMTGFTQLEEDLINGATDAGEAAYQLRSGADVGVAAAGSPQGQPQNDTTGRSGTGTSAGDARPQAAGRDTAYPEFHAKWRAGATNEELIQDPVFVNAVGVMLTRPATSRMPGFDSVDWHAKRKYMIDGAAVTGTDAALDKFYTQAGRLAADELKLPVKPVQNNRVLTIITGPPASGKSTIANEIAYANGSAILDSDEYKKALPEFGDGSGANAVHTESKGIADAMEEILIAQGANIVYPKVGHEAGSIQKLGQKFKAAGYTVNLVNLDVPAKTAMHRMLGRFGSSGRLIPPTYLLDEVGDNPSRVHNEMERTGEFDGYARLDGLAPYGRTPDVLSQTGNPLAGTKFDQQVPDGSPAERGRATAQPGTAGPDRQSDSQTPVALGKDDPTVNPDKATVMADYIMPQIAAEMANRGPKSALTTGVVDGSITRDTITKAITVAADGINMRAADTIQSMGEALLPNATAEVQRNAGLRLLNNMSAFGKGKFYPKQVLAKPKFGNQKVSVTTLKADDKLKAYLEIKAPQKSRFYAPGDFDPADTSGIKGDPLSNKMAGPALERAKRAAAALQQNVYELDNAALQALTVEDFLGADKIAALKDLYGDDISIQMDAQEARLERFKAAGKDHAGKQISFQYKADDKGRLYANGEFHPQAGDNVKKLFIQVAKDGTRTPLGQMDEIDHTGSGWQIAAIMAGDEKLAPIVNIHGGQATMASPKRGDIYTSTIAKMKEVATNDAKAGDANAKLFLDKVASNSKFNRVNIKPAVIAINYGGGPKNFRDSLQAIFAGETTGAPEGFWSYVDKMGFEAVEAMGPATAKMKRWAQNILKAAVSVSADPKALTFSVGQDTAFTGLKNETALENFDAKDPRDWADIARVRRNYAAPTDQIDIGGTARTLFSQIIQGYDASILHEAVNDFKTANPDAFVTTNHDSYTQKPEHTGAVAGHVRAAMARVMGAVDPMQRLYDEVDAQVGVDKINNWIAALPPAKRRSYTPITPPPAKGSYKLDELATAIPLWVEGDTKVPPPFSPIAAGTDATRREPEAVGQSGVDMANRLSEAYKVAASKAYTMGRDFKADLQAKALAAQREQGIDLSKLTPENESRIADFVVEDATEALQDNANAVGWYDRTMKDALTTMAELHPELATDPAAKLRFVWALAVTSNGIKVGKNFQMADAAYTQSKTRAAGQGTFPMIGVGTAAQPINDGLRAYDAMLAKLGSTEALAAFMTKEAPVKEIEAQTGVAISGEGKNTVVRGAAILGPKIGNGFFANLYGHFDALTMDRWLMRSVGRWRGTLIQDNADMIAKKRGELKAHLSSLSAPELDYLRGFFNGAPFTVSKTMTNTSLDALATEVKKRSIVPEWRERINAAPGGAGLRTLGNMYWKYLDGQVEAPAGAGERTFIRNAFKQALERLRKVPGNEDMTMADLQALLWYPERRLYDAAKEKVGVAQQKGYADADAPDYANAARALVDQRLGRSGGPGSGRDAGGAGQGAGESALSPTARGTDQSDVRQRGAGDGNYGGSPREAQRQDRVAGKPAKSVREFEDGRHVYETDPKTFARAIAAARSKLGPLAAQVGTDPGSRQFLFDDGASGFALDGDNIISVFSTPGKSPKGTAGRVIEAAVAEGGRKLDAFDTFLPEVYAKHGFKAVARLPFNTEYAPKGWDYGHFKAKFGTGKPDVVFMAYDPANASPDTDNTVSDYDAGVAAQDASPSPVAKGVDTATAAVGGPPSTDVQFKLSNTAVKPRQRIADARHTDTNYDRDTIFANILDKGKDGAAYRQVVADTAKTLKAWVAGTSLPRGDAAAMMGAIDEHVRQKGLHNKGRSLDNAMASQLMTDLGGLMARGRATEADIAKGLNTSRERAAKIAASAKAAYARAAPTARGIDVAKGIRALPDHVGSAFPELQGLTNAATASAIRGYADPKGELASIGSHLWSGVRDFETAFVNRFAPVRRLEEQVRGGLGIGAESAFKAAEFAVNDSGRQEALMHYGAAKLGQHGEFTTADGTVGLTTIFDKAVEGKTGEARGQTMADWMGWMVAKRVKELQAKHPDMVFPLGGAELDAALAKEQPQFKEAADMWKTHNDANIDFLVQTGRIKPVQAAALKQAEHYVPFYRSDERVDGTPTLNLDQVMSRSGPRAAGELLSRNPGIKKMVGGDKMMIDNILKNMVKNSQAMVAAGMRNDAANKIFNLMEDAGMADVVRGEVQSADGTKMVATEKPNGDAVSMFKGGKRFWVIPKGEASVPLITAMAGLQPLQMSRIQSLMASIGAVFRQGITLSPAFMVRNAIRGAVSAGILTSGANLGRVNNTYTGFREALRNSDATRAFKAVSGMGDYSFGNLDAGMGKDDILLDYGLGPKTFGYRMRNVLKMVEDVGSATELADRIAAYKNMIAEGVRPDEAAYRALNIINYGRKGNSPTFRHLLATVPFLNARIQGLRRLAEGATSKNAVERRNVYKQLALNGALLSVASAALWAKNYMDDDDWEKYKAEPLARRVNYHIIYLGGKTILIPKAFEIGHIFSSIPEMLADQATGELPGNLPLGLKKIVADNFMFNAIPAAALPVVEGLTNYSFFKQEAIEGIREQSLRVADRTTGSTGLSRIIGQNLGLSDAAGLSPAMIEHYMQGYGGTYYAMLSAATDLVGAETGLTTAPVGGAFGDVPVLSSLAQSAFGSMAKNTEMDTSRFLENFYNNKDYITQIYRSAKEARTTGDVEYANKLMAQAPQTAAAYTFMNKQAAKMSAFNKDIRMIRTNPKMSSAEKRDKLKPLITQRNKLAAQVEARIREMETAQGITFKDAS